VIVVYLALVDILLKFMIQVDYFTLFNFPFNFEFSPLQTIERSWETAKERNKRQVGAHRSIIDSYMCEYMWRNHVKVKNEDSLKTILRDISVFWPLA